MYTYVPDLIDPQTVETISRYFENKLAQSSMERRMDDSYDHTGNNPSAFYCYSDPLIEVVLRNCTDRISEVVGKRLAPTYSYSRIYLGDDDLAPHTDRPSCEYSVTVNVATVGEPWPIWMNVDGRNPARFVIRPGDCVVYKGCEVEHWRDPMSDTNSEINVQFMLHYVDMDGPFADYKYDKRNSLGALAPDNI
jgi:hypothetical protein